MKILNSGMLYAKDTSDNVHFNIPVNTNTTIKELKEFLGKKVCKNPKQLVLRYNDKDLKVIN